jgi:hypothetical protein
MPSANRKKGRQKTISGNLVANGVPDGKKGQQLSGRLTKPGFRIQMEPLIDCAEIAHRKEDPNRKKGRYRTKAADALIFNGEEWMGRNGGLD